MGLFPRFSSLINLNTQQPLKADSEISENAKSKSASKKDFNNNDPTKEKRYYDMDEELKQDDLWSEAEEKHPWHDAPPKVKVTTKNGLCHMNIELTVGLSPPPVYFQMTNPSAKGFFDHEKRRNLLETKSRKVLREDGPRQIAKSEITLAWDFLWWSIPIPITLIVDENKKDRTTKYKKEKMMFMKVFKGSYKVEPLFVDSERFCKNKLPKSKEEYKKCSGGQGKIASKVIMDQYFQPYTLFNFPPLSWYIRRTTIKTTKTLLTMTQRKAFVIRSAERHF